MRSLLFIACLVLFSGCSCERPSGNPDAPLPLDAPTDVATLDAPILDDAPAIVDAPEDAPADGGVCTRDPYPLDYGPTREERLVQEAAAAAFTADTGATPSFNDVTGSVNGFTGGNIAIELDPTITDPCARAHAGLLAFFTRYEEMMRVPDGMTVRVCHYDDITDAEVVRLHGGTYDGRPLLTATGAGNDLVAHVTRGGRLNFFAGEYLPAYQRGTVEPCLTPEEQADAVIGEAMGYQTFSACVPGPSGEIVIDAIDTRTAGEPELYLDEAGNAHIVRRVEVLLDPSRVTPTEVNSDLFCCAGAGVGDCVGKILIVDEVTGEILEQRPRCHTC